MIPEAFDAVYSSHVIEHRPDLVHYLRDVATILGDSGAYFILCPDTRYCFNAVLVESTIADVLDAYLSARRVHTFRSVLPMYMTTNNNQLIHWRDGSEAVSLDLDRIRKRIDKLHEVNGAYVDAYAWRFTPNTFGQIIEKLREMELVSVPAARVYDTPYGWNEFGAILIKDHSN